MIRTINLTVLERHPNWELKDTPTQKPVKAWVHGPLCTHPLRYGNLPVGYTITHIASGRRVATLSTRKYVLLCLKALAALEWPNDFSPTPELKKAATEIIERFIKLEDQELNEHDEEVCVRAV
jgi:hypothetical protein